DAVRRAVGRTGADEALRGFLLQRLEECTSLPLQFREKLDRAVRGAFELARAVARDAARERHARIAASALYNAASAAMLAWEATRPGVDARRALVARFVLEHRLEAADPLNPRDDRWEREAIALLLDRSPVALDRASALLIA
ncbi:MAG TPA: DNA alkylation response protein, partial [Hyphomicrobiaceae bacterium]|nr:DNA alkylation response protein [Hyphomicrobiaceae bacterium]